MEKGIFAQKKLFYVILIVFEIIEMGIAKLFIYNYVVSMVFNGSRIDKNKCESNIMLFAYIKQYFTTMNDEKETT